MAEMPTQNGEIQPHEFALDPGDVLVFGEGLGEPYDHVTMVGGSRTKRVGIVAQIETPYRTFIISPGSQGESDFAEIRHVVRREDGTAINLSNPQRMHVRQGLPLGHIQDAEDRISLSGDGSHPDGFMMHNSGSTPISVKAAPTEKPIFEPSYEKRQLRKSKIRKGIATIALAAASVLPVYTEIHDKIESSKPNYAYNETLRLTKENSIERAKELARTMQDIDDGNLDAVKRRAEAYRDKTPSQLPSQALIEKTDKQISEANTNQEVVDALGGFMDFYDKDVDFFTKEEAAEKNAKTDFMEYGGFEPDTPVANTKALAHAVVNGYKVLPKQFMEAMDFEKISFGGESPDYKGYNDSESIVLGVSNSRMGEALSQANANLAGNASDEWFVLHELGHSEQADSLYFDDFNFEDDAKQPDIIDQTKASIKDAIDIYTENPDAPSAYAYAKGGVEKDAEIFAGLMTPNEKDFKGIGTPRDATYFHSKSNRYMLSKLVQLQGDPDYDLNTSKDAPFSDWLFAHKLGLL